MSKKIGECFGPSTRDLSFGLRYPSFLLSKFVSQLKLIQSVVRIGILGICVTSSILRVLLSGFWTSGSQIPSPRDPVLGSWVSGPSSRVLSVRVSCLRVLEPQVPDSRVSGPGSQGPRVSSLSVLRSWISGFQVSGSRVSGSRVSGSQGPRVPGVRVSGSRVSVSWVPGLRS